MLPSMLFEVNSYTQKVPLLPKLRGQFAEFLNDGSLEGLGTFIPVYLCWFAVRSSKYLINEAFLGSLESTEFYEANFIVLPPLRSSIESILTLSISLTGRNTRCPIRMLCLSFCVTPLTQTINYRCWNIHQLSIDFSFRIRLRTD